MKKYALEVNEKRSAKVYGRALPISTKDSVAICKVITGMNLAKAKNLLVGMLSEKMSIDGKYYTKAAFEMLKLIGSAESNAEFKGLNPEGMIIHASAHEGYTFYRPRRFKMHRTKKKVTHVQVILEGK